MIVVLAERPTAESPISGMALATRKATAAATVRARVRSRESALRAATILPHLGQRAFSRGRSGGRRCSRSQSGQAIRLSGKEDTVSFLEPRR
jgi:hypothetical protein